MIAIIVENRFDPSEIIQKHMSFLPGWEHVWINDISIKSAADYNDFLTSKDFWLEFISHDKVLVFQQDSMLLRKGIEEFEEWDYVGAPWKKYSPWNTHNRSGGNGGLSLRCPKKSLDLISEKPYHPRYGNEDVYYSHFLPIVGGNVAPYEVCKRFSCETEFELGTLGYHAIQKHLSTIEVDQVLNQYDNK